jgi:hypothetical protein
MEKSVPNFPSEHIRTQEVIRGFVFLSAMTLQPMALPSLDSPEATMEADPEEELHL